MLQGVRASQSVMSCNSPTRKSVTHIKWKNSNTEKHIYQSEWLLTNEEALSKSIHPCNNITIYILYYTMFMLYHIELLFFLIYHILLYVILVYHIISSHTILHCILWYYILVLHYIISYYIILYYILLYYILVYFISNNIVCIWQYTYICVYMYIYIYLLHKHPSRHSNPFRSIQFQSMYASILNIFLCTSENDTHLNTHHGNRTGQR